MVVLAGLVLACHSNRRDNLNALFLLKNQQTQVGILPRPGGRVVLLRKPGMQNVFKSNSNLWCDEKAWPQVSAFSRFQAFNGHIVWLGPQKEWWIRQHINTKRRDNRAIWPPDPYLIYGNYEITAKTDTSATLLGPKSPVSGVQLSKKITLHSDGRVTFFTRATNIRDEPVSWGLWMNTRLPGWARCYVPAFKDDLVELAVRETESEKPLPYCFYNGYFTFLCHRVSAKPNQKYVQKAFLNPGEPFMAGFCKDQLLKISFAAVAPDRIHPQHAPVEIYNICSAEESLLELEMHGPYTTLEPGDSMHLLQTWQLYRYHGAQHTKRHVEFIEKHLKGS